MELSIFTYSACINPIHQTTRLKKEIHAFFSHADTTQISAIYSLKQHAPDTLRHIVANLFNLSPSTLEIDETRRYQTLMLYIFKLPDPYPPFTIATMHATYHDQSTLTDLINIVSLFYQEQDRKFTTHCYYSDCFQSYMNANQIDGIKSHWVSPTTALHDTFQIRAHMTNTKQPLSQIPDIYPYNRPLSSGNIKPLETLLFKVQNTLPPKSVAKHTLTTLSSELLAIAKGAVFGDMKYIFNQYVTCLKDNADHIQLPMRQPHLQQRKRASLFKRLTQKTPLSPPLPKRPTPPLAFILDHLQKKIDEFGLTEHFIPTENDSLTSA